MNQEWRCATPGYHYAIVSVKRAPTANGECAVMYS